MANTIAQDTQTYLLQIPQSDVRFLSALVKKMGWTKKKTQATEQKRKCELDKALEDIRQGRIYRAESVDDLFKQLEM